MDTALLIVPWYAVLFPDSTQDYNQGIPGILNCERVTRESLRAQARADHATSAA
jgi:hypothetical protein